MKTNTSQNRLAWGLIAFAFIGLLYMKPGFYGYAGYVDQIWYKLPMLILIGVVGFYLARQNRKRIE